MNTNALAHRIHVLPESLANQIAAGEVVERPASVIKELLENSIDAGAKNIHIEIEKGGSRLIRVRDDGDGIHSEDMGLALQGHATSKIRRQSDLQHIASLGFRGEALPSIASVSQFQLTSRLRGSDAGWQIKKDLLAGIDELLPASHPVGTTVEVKNLFHVTPARRKFLRSERTEFLHILEMVRRIALSRFDVTIHLNHNDKQVFFCRPDENDRTPLLKSIMGKTFSQSARMFNYTTTDIRLWGWLGLADLSRSQTDRQYFYLNGRMIRDKQVSHAIRMAFEDAIPIGRYPTYVMHLELDPAAVDVNVHPSKYEVRFKNSRDVHDFIYACLKRTLAQESQLINGIDTANTYSNMNPDASGSTMSNATGRSYIRELPQHYSMLSGNKNNELSLANVPALGQPITHLYGRFIISKRQNDYLLIDIYQARRHLVKTRMQSAQADRPVRHRPLLVPISINVSVEEADRIDHYSRLISHYGLTLDRNSPDSVIVRDIPTVLSNVELQALVQDILIVIRTMADEDSVKDKLIAVFADHAGDGMGDNMTMDDMLKLLRSLEDTGLDMSNSEHPGIWKILTIEALSLLLNSEPV